MKCIDKFFAVREKMNKALQNEDLDSIQVNFPVWIWQQCINYSGLSEKERELSADISTLDHCLKIEYCWPSNFVAKQQYKGIISVVTHELSRTGAPLVLLDAVRIMKERGYFVILFSPEDGMIKEDFLNIGVPVIIAEYVRWLDKIEENLECSKFCKMFEAMVRGSNLLFCNTVVTYPVVKKFCEQDMPVFWWIHEGQMILEQIKENLPEVLSSNIYPFFVSVYSQKAFEKNGFIYENSSVMSYGIEDITQISDTQTEENRIHFITAGTISQIKAQDILLDAIELLDEKISKRCDFLFVGKNLDNQVYDKVCAAARNNVSVEYKSEVDHETLLEIMKLADCVICPSRDDAMPVVATEAFALEKVVICSDHTGTAEYIQNDQNGFVFKNENVNELKILISKVCELEKEERNKIGKNARDVFEHHFTKKRFECTLTENIEKIIRKEEKNFKYLDKNEAEFTKYLQRRLIQLNDMHINLKLKIKKQGDDAYRDSVYLHGLVQNLEVKKNLLEDENNKLEQIEKELKKQIDNLRIREKFFQEEVNKLQTKSSELEEQLNSVYNSLSWKITEPFRKIGDIWNGKES